MTSLLRFLSRIASSLALLLLLCNAVAWGQPATAGFSDGALEAAKTYLREERFGDARTASNEAIQSFLSNTFLTDAQTRAGLTRAVVYRAIAESRQIRPDLAEWDWYVAANMDPNVAATVLSDIEGAAAFPSVNSLWVVPPGTHHVGAADRSVTPPKSIRRVEPKYPMRARRLQVEMPIKVETIIDTSGQLGQPRVLTTAADPSLIFAALEALREWTFEPGRVDDEPVPVIFNLTIAFKLAPAA